MMVNYSTNINKINNHLSLQLFEHKKTLQHTLEIQYWQGEGTKMLWFFFLY